MGHNYLRRISSRFTLVGFLAPIKPLKRDTRLLYSIPTNSRPMDKGLAPGAGWGANSSRALYQDPTLQISNLVAFADGVATVVDAGGITLASPPSWRRETMT